MQKRIAYTFVIKMLIALTNLSIVIVLSRFIGAEGKGEASLIVASVALVLLFCNIVGGASLPYFVPRYNIFLLFFLSNLWTIFICGASFLFLYFNQYILSEFIYPIILLALLSSFLATNLSILLGKDRVMLFNTISLLQVVLNLVLLFVLFQTSGLSVWSYIYSYIFALVLCILISIVFIFKYFKEISMHKISNIFLEMLKLGFNNQLGHVFKFLSGRMTFYFIFYFSGDASLGVFSNAVSIIESIFIISNSYATILYPKVLNSVDDDKTKEMSLAMMKQSSIVCFFALIVVLLLPREFWVWLFGSEFSQIKLALIILSPGVLFHNVTLVLSHYFSGVGKISFNTFSNLFGLLGAIILSMIIIPGYDIFEASIVITISNIIIALSTVYFFKNNSLSNLKNIFPGVSDLKIIISEFNVFFANKKK